MSPSSSPCTPSATQVEHMLAELIGQMPPVMGRSDAPHLDRPPRGRPRILPSLVLWAGLLTCVLQGWSSQLALYRLVSSGRFWHYPRFAISDQAVYKRLAQAGTAPLEALFTALTALLRVRLEPLLPAAFVQLAPFASEVVALDESTLDQMARSLPALQDRRAVAEGSPALLAGRIAALFDVRRQLFRHVLYRTDATQNEKVAARVLLATLPPHSLILADLGYFSFRWFDDLTAGGHFFLSRLRAKTSYTRLHTFYEHDHVLDALIFLGAYRADRAQHAVRLLQFQAGTTTYRYITNVLDPQLLSLRDAAALYARRWDIELAFRLLKEHLHLHLIWSAKSVVIQQQLWAALSISQVLHALQFEIAARAECDPFEVSLPLLVEYLPRYAAAGVDPIAAFVADGRQVGFIRPSARLTPRAPDIALDQIIPLPPALELERTAHYADKP